MALLKPRLSLSTSLMFVMWGNLCLHSFKSAKVVTAMQLCMRGRLHISFLIKRFKAQSSPRAPLYPRSHPCQITNCWPGAPPRASSWRSVTTVPEVVHTGPVPPLRALEALSLQALSLGWLTYDLGMMTPGLGEREGPGKWMDPHTHMWVPRWAVPVVHRARVMSGSLLH